MYKHKWVLQWNRRHYVFSQCWMLPNKEKPSLCICFSSFCQDTTSFVTSVLWSLKLLPAMTRVRDHWEFLSFRFLYHTAIVISIGSELFARTQKPHHTSWYVPIVPRVLKNLIPCGATSRHVWGRASDSLTLEIPTLFCSHIPRLLGCCPLLIDSGGLCSTIVKLWDIVQSL